MSLNRSQKALGCVESEKIKIKYACVGKSIFLLTHTCEFSLFSWVCNLSLAFCNASFSSLSLSLSDLSFLKSSSYICTCNHYDQVCEFQQSHTEILIHFFCVCGCFLNTCQPEGCIQKGSLQSCNQNTFPHLFFFKLKIANEESPVAHINWNSPQLHCS